MGKYFIGWLLGVPAGLLILVHIFTSFDKDSGHVPSVRFTSQSA